MVHENKRRFDLETLSVINMQKNSADRLWFLNVHFKPTKPTRRRAARCSCRFWWTCPPHCRPSHISAPRHSCPDPEYPATSSASSSPSTTWGAARPPLPPPLFLSIIWHQERTRSNTCFQSRTPQRSSTALDCPCFRGMSARHQLHWTVRINTNPGTSALFWFCGHLQGSFPANRPRPWTDDEFRLAWCGSCEGRRNGKQFCGDACCYFCTFRIHTGQSCSSKV